MISFFPNYYDKKDTILNFSISIKVSIQIIYKLKGDNNTQTCYENFLSNHFNHFHFKLQLLKHV